jgi:tRNA(fMet)-specific endonuclease VapC
VTTAYLLDTNIVTAILRKEPTVLECLESRFRANDRILVSAVVHYEIKRGFLRRDATRQLADFEAWLRHWEWLEVERSHWEAAAVLCAKCRRAGIAISDVDLLLAVQARHLQAVVATRDKGFEHLDVACENWLVSPQGA